jgi:hypothetical protein
VLGSSGGEEADIDLEETDNDVVGDGDVDDRRPSSAIIVMMKRCVVVSDFQIDFLLASSR